MNRTYSLITIRSVDEEKRVIEGIATTPGVARDGDILETKGIRFNLPVPFLFNHNHKTPMGNVVSADVSEAGIAVRIQVAPQGTADFIDEGWRLIKAGVVRGLSIGWRTLKESFDKSFNGFRISESEWLELSAVPVPADANATILSVRSADSAVLAALGSKERTSVVRIQPQPAAAAAKRKGNTMTIAEQIVSFEQKRAADEARMDALIELSTKESRTLTPEEQDEYDGHEREVKEVDGHIKRLKDREKSILARAVTVSADNTNTTQRAVETRTGHIISVKPNREKGIGMARVAMALIQARGNRFEAQQIAKEMWPDDTEIVDGIRAVIEAGDTTTSGWASQLVPNAIQTDFIQQLRPMTVFGKIAGFRRVPFNSVVPIQSTGGTYSWVGEAVAKPVSALNFTSATLRWGKIAGIIVLTQELARFSNPSAEALVRDDMLEGLARQIDTYFLGTTAAVSNVSPAGILNGISSTATTGTTAATFLTDMNNLLNNFTANNIDLTRLTLLMSSTQALAISLMTTSLGVPLYPNLGLTGGTLFGLPVIVSETVGTKIIAIDPTQILVADDGGITIDVSTEASIEMSSTPIVGDTSPITGATVKSLWQNNLVGLRAEKFITWVAARTSAIEYLTSVAYVP